MQTLDFLVVGAVLIALLAINVRFARRAGRSTTEFILGNRKMPWWLAGISVAATHFNANNVLQDTRKSREDGIAGMWFTWTQVIGGAIGTAWFYRLWRRAGFNTQMEFYLARYSGWQAHFARIFDSVIYGGVVSLLWGALGLIGMKKVLHVLFVIPATVPIGGLAIPTDWLIVLGLVLLSLVYTALAGVHGLVWTDLLEFTISVVASYGLLMIIWTKVGGGSGLRQQLHALGPVQADSLRLLPPYGLVFFYYLFLSPLLAQGGWSPAVQRFLCVKDEKEVVYTAISNSVFIFALRGVPLVLVGLAAWVLVPDARLLADYPALMGPGGSLLPDRERIYPLLALQLLPTGLLGLTMAAFLSAFIAALNTNLHNSTSIFVNDLYRAYLRPGRSDRHYVKAARVYVIFATAAVVVIAVTASNILWLTMLTVTLVTSAGLVKLLRFVWWRINGSAEVAGQATSVLGVVYFLTPAGRHAQAGLAHGLGLSGNDGEFIARQLTLVAASTLATLVTTVLTRPEPRERLVAFFRLVRPFGAWGAIRREAGTYPADPVGLLVTLTFAVIGFVLGVIFCLLTFFLALWGTAACAGVVAAISWFWVRWTLVRLYPNEPAPLPRELAVAGAG